MHNINLSGDELFTLIMSLDIEAYRIRQYYAALTQQRSIAEISSFDSNRLEKIEALHEKLKKIQDRKV